MLTNKNYKLVYKIYEYFESILVTFEFFYAAMVPAFVRELTIETCMHVRLEVTTWYSISKRCSILGGVVDHKNNARINTIIDHIFHMTI